MDGGVPVSEIVDQVTHAGNTILHITANTGSQEITRLIADRFHQLITRRNMKGDTVLHAAARTIDSFLIDIVLSCYTWHSANDFYEDDEEELMKIRNEYGNTALAVMIGNVIGAEVLFRAAVAVAHFLNKEGKSPLYLAVESGNNRILARMLLEAPFQNRERHYGNSPLHAAILATTDI